MAKTFDIAELKTVAQRVRKSLLYEDVITLVDLIDDFIAESEGSK